MQRKKLFSLFSLIYVKCAGINSRFSNRTQMKFMKSLETKFPFPFALKMNTNSHSIQLNAQCSFSNDTISYSNSTHVLNCGSSHSCMDKNNFAEQNYLYSGLIIDVALLLREDPSIEYGKFLISPSIEIVYYFNAYFVFRIRN